MAESNRDRINPSLLDRLTDEAPGAAGGRGGSTSRAINAYAMAAAPTAVACA